MNNNITGGSEADVLIDVIAEILKIVVRNQQNTSKKFSRNSKKQPETSYYIVENKTKAVLHGTFTIEFDGFAQSITLKLSSTKCTQPQAILNTSQT